MVVTLGTRGLSNDEIADAMVLGPATARTHVSRAMIKLGARDRAQLVVFARFEQAAALAHETGAPPAPSSRSPAPPGWSASSGVNLKGRDSDTRTTRATRRARPRPPRTRPRRLRRLARPTTCPAEQKCRICAHHASP